MPKGHLLVRPEKFPIFIAVASQPGIDFLPQFKIVYNEWSKI